MRIRSYKDAAELLTGRNKDSRKIANHTYLHRIDENTIAVKLHATDVVTYRADGSIVLNSGGYRTATTKDRINEFSPVTIWQANGHWTVGIKASDYTHVQGTSVSFADGLTLLPDGTFDAATVGNDPKAIARTVKRIKKYCDAYMLAFDAGDVPKPDSGDCFYCLMREVSTGKPLGECVKDHSHIDSHIEESYFVPSLLARAIERFSVAPIAMALISDKWAGTNNYGNTDSDYFLKFASEQLHKSLYRYIKEQFGIAA